MNQPRGTAQNCAMACLMLGAVSLAAIPPAGAQGSSNSPANIVPALKCADLSGWKIPGSTIVVNKAQDVPEAPPGTVQPSNRRRRRYRSRCRQTAVRMA